MSGPPTLHVRAFAIKAEDGTLGLRIDVWPLKKAEILPLSAAVKAFLYGHFDCAGPEIVITPPSEPFPDDGKANH